MSCVAGESMRFSVAAAGGAILASPANTHIESQTKVPAAWCSERSTVGRCISTIAAAISTCRIAAPNAIRAASTITRGSARRREAQQQTPHKWPKSRNATIRCVI